MFTPAVTHITVECWSCGHSVERQREDVPVGIDRHKFESRSKCGRCGASWPRVTTWPRPASVYSRAKG